MSLVYVDTNIFISAFQGGDTDARRLLEIISLFENSPNVLATSEMTLAEVGARDITAKKLANILYILSVFIEFVPVSLDILLATCSYRIELKKQGRSMKLPDAIHCVTAIDRGCKFMFSADQRLWVPDDMERVTPDEAGLSILQSILDA